MYPHEHFWWGGWWMFPAMPLFFIIIMVVFMVLFFRRGWFTRPPRCDSYHDKGFESALDILKKRYAKGEISRDEFERMKKDIADS